MLYCDAKYSDILWGSSHVYCCYFPCAVRLPKFSAWTLQCNNQTAIIWGGVAVFVAFSQVEIFQEKQRILQQFNLCLSNKPKKAFIRSFDTNNSTQSLTRMYSHTSNESLYRLHGAKISWRPTLGGVSYQFGLFNFSTKVPMFFSLFAKTTCSKWQQKVGQFYLNNELSCEGSFLLLVSDTFFQ